MSEMTDDLLRMLIGLAGRVAFPPVTLRQLVSPQGRSNKHVAAYNLCTGDRSQGEIQQALKLDKGNFSRTIKRWEALGIVSRVGPDRAPLHLYPLTEEAE